MLMDGDNPMSKITEILQSVSSPHLEWVTVTIIGYMPALDNDTAWKSLGDTLSARKWPANAELPRLWFIFMWNDDFGPSKVSKQNFRDMRSQLSTLIETKLLKVTKKDFWGN
jgi:hypothetical protein